MKKHLLLASILLTSQIAFAKVSIPRGETERRLGKEVAMQTGLIKQDERYSNALVACANADVEAKDYFIELLNAINSDEFQSLTRKQKEAELSQVRIAVKMLCRDQIDRAGIDM